ncbi:STAS domain-containing protein [Solirubrobacter soli]|uniref:STAS domain-containing protein n=1 Tax=Solirubrobacter soli TaxID=363832 RepID=UPI00040C172F|nr:STAS domain-containing protein [Solirubrobacter soli]
MKRALAVTIQQRPGATLVTVEGELDLDGAPRLCAAIQDGRRPARPEQVIVDLTCVEFCDSTGLRALMDASREVAVSGGRLIVIAPEDGPVRRVIAMSGADEFLALTADRDQVLGAFHGRSGAAPCAVSRRRTPAG